MADEIIQQGVIGITTDASGVKTGLAAALQDVKQFEGQAVPAMDKVADGVDGVGEAAVQLSQRTQNLIRQIEKQTATAEGGAVGMRTYQARLINASEAVAPYIKGLDDAQRATEKLAADNKFLTSLQAQAQAVNRTKSELLELQAAERGLSEQAAPAIAILRSQEDASVALQKQVNDLIASIQKQTATVTAGAVGLRTHQAALLNASDSVKPYIQQLEAANRASEKLASDTRFLSSLQSQAAAIGKTRSELAAMEAAERGLSAQAAPAIAALKAQEDALNNGGAKLNAYGQSAKATAAAMRGVPAQLTDIVVSLQGGQAPLTVLLQQGGQLKDMFGGIRPAAAALGNAMLALVNPYTVAAAAVAAFTYVLYQSEQRTRAANGLQVQLEAIGRSAETSRAQLKAYTDELARSPGVSRDAAKGAVEALATNAGLNAGMMGQLLGITADFARATGKDATEAAKALGTAFADPKAGAEALDKQFQLLTASQALNIQSMIEQGNTVGAQQALFEALKERVSGLATEGLTPLQQATSDFGNAWDKMLESLGKTDIFSQAAGGLAGIVRGLTTGIEKLDALFSMTPPAWVKDAMFGAAGGALFGGLPGAAVGAVGGALTGAGLRAAGVMGNTGGATGGWSGGASGGWDDTGGGSGGRNPVTELDKAAKAFIAQNKAVAATKDQIVQYREEMKKANELLDQFKAKGEGSSEAAMKLGEIVAGFQEKIKKAQQPGANAAKRDEKAELQREVDEENRKAQTNSRLVSNQLKLLEAERAVGAAGDAEYFARRKVLIQQDADATAKALNAQIDLYKKAGGAGKDGSDNQRKATDLAEKLKQTEDDRKTRLTEIDELEKRTANARVAQYAAAKFAAEDYLNTLTRGYQRELDAYGQGARATQIAQGRNQIGDRYQQQRSALAGQRQDTAIKQEGRLTPEQEKTYDDLLQVLNDFEVKALASYDGYVQARIGKERDWVNGATGAFADYQDSAANMMAQSQQIFSNAFKGMEDAIVSFATTGKLSFTSLATSIIADLIRIQVRASLVKVLEGSNSGGGGLFGSLISAGLAAFGGGGVQAAGVQASGAVTSAVAGGSVTGVALPPLAGGGYTGPGGRTTPAGVVHRGEVVFSQDDVARNGGVANVEAMRTGRHRGYSAGGAVDVAVPAMAGAANMKVDIHNYRGADTEVTTEQKDNGDGTFSMDVIIRKVEDALAGRVAGGQGQLGKAMASRFGLRGG